MPRDVEVVITGLGVVSPLGFDGEDFWNALLAAKSGVGRASYDTPELPSHFAAEITAVNPADYVRPKKSLKVMSRDAILAIACASRGMSAAGMAVGDVDPERLGVVFGADRVRLEMTEVTPGYQGGIVDGRFDLKQWVDVGIHARSPLNFLRTLPNMAPCHVSISLDARGPNNTLMLGEVSSLLALAEAVDVIQRGAADVMIAGGASARVNLFDTIRWSATEDLTRKTDDPARLCRPFDAERSGQVRGEGGAAFVLESRQRAEARGAKILAAIRGSSSTCLPPKRGVPRHSEAIERALANALKVAGTSPAEIGHVNAHGLSTALDDAHEAQAIQRVFGRTPVVAPKSVFGNAGAGCGALELAVSVLAIERGLVPPTANYEKPDPACPVNVVHKHPLDGSKPMAVKVNHTRVGQAAAVVLAKP